MFERTRASALREVLRTELDAARRWFEVTAGLALPVAAEVSLCHLAFHAQDDPERAREVRQLCAVKDEFTVDAASVIIQNDQQTLRLPKGPAAYDRPRVPLHAISL